MHKFHILVAGFNLFCLFLFTFSLLFSMYFNLPKGTLQFPLIVGMMGGYFANFLALGITVLLSLVLLAKFIQNKHKDFIKEHKLGLFNGIFVVFFWIIMSWIGKIPIS